MESARCSVCGSAAFAIVATGRDYIYHGTGGYFSQVRCDDCGHFYLNPRPTIAALPLMYPSDYGTFSDRFRGGANLLARIKRAVNLRRIKDVVAALPAGAKVLDVGCGNGELLVALRRARPDIEVFGLDWFFPAKTREILEAQGIHIIEAPLETAELPVCTFDLVLMLQIIEHLWQPESGVQRIAGALAQGGRLLIETPNTDGWDRRFFADGTWGGYYFPRHLNLYNFERIARLLAHAGLAIERQRNLPAPVIWCYSLQGIVQERLGWKGRLAKLFDVRNLPLLAAFAALDIVASLIGASTSNQQTVAMKPR
ncbi:MAG: class I SAM-dependent methyltransferase [Rhodospirillaceae bacterium]|nr:MAG: class I SAM-dependent methyltransferase [Rhodospirillaceae bacterium]